MKSQTAEMTVEKLGPRIDSPDDAINGFLRSNNIKSIDDCDILDDKKGKRYRYIETVPAKMAITILPPIIEEIIRKFSWPKSMRWGNGNSRWVRPLRNIMAIIYDNNSVNKLKINIEGLLANDYTFGHRFLKNQKNLHQRSQRLFRSSDKSSCNSRSRAEKRIDLRTNIKN